MEKLKIIVLILSVAGLGFCFIHIFSSWYKQNTGGNVDEASLFNEWTYFPGGFGKFEKYKIGTISYEKYNFTNYGSQVDYDCNSCKEKSACQYWCSFYSSMGSVNIMNIFIIIFYILILVSQLVTFIMSKSSNPNKNLLDIIYYVLLFETFIGGGLLIVFTVVSMGKFSDAQKPYEFIKMYWSTGFPTYLAFIQSIILLALFGIFLVDFIQYKRRGTPTAMSSYSKI